jgi:hypothetical protein
MVMSVSVEPQTQFAEAVRFRVTGVPMYTTLVNRIIGSLTQLLAHGGPGISHLLNTTYSCFFSLSQIYLPNTKHKVATV